MKRPSAAASSTQGPLETTKDMEGGMCLSSCTCRSKEGDSCCERPRSRACDAGGSNLRALWAQQGGRHANGPAGSPSASQ